MRFLSPKVDRKFLVTTQIKFPGNSGHGTGFFYNYQNTTYLVTNEHVLNEDGHGEAKIWFRSVDDVKEVEDEGVQLRDNSGNPNWLEHPFFPVDLAVLPLDARLDEVNVEEPSTGSLALSQEQFAPNDINLSGGSSALVVGYPEGFIDSNTRFPTIRDARLASPFDIPFEGQPFFITDAKMHPGTSGSPVFSEPSVHTEIRGKGSVLAAPSSYFLGVHSATFYSGYYPSEREPLNLNQVWYGEAIEEVIALNNLSEDEREMLDGIWEVVFNDTIPDPIEELLVHEFDQEFIEHLDKPATKEEIEKILDLYSDIIDKM